MITQAKLEVLQLCRCFVPADCICHNLGRTFQQHISLYPFTIVLENKMEGDKNILSKQSKTFSKRKESYFVSPWKGLTTSKQLCRDGIHALSMFKSHEQNYS